MYQPFMPSGFSTAWHKSNDGNTFHLTNKYLHKMATLHNYKCHKCGFRILSSKDGDNSVLLWFQNEVVKGEESKYFGKNLIHDAVIWTEETFWDKLFRFLHRRKYAKFINFSEFIGFTKRGEIRKTLAYKNSANNVKCILCNGNAELWNPSKGCPICGNVLEKQENYMIFAD